MGARGEPSLPFAGVTLDGTPVLFLRSLRLCNTLIHQLKAIQFYLLVSIEWEIFMFSNNKKVI
jgi:hypothetical protein